MFRGASNFDKLLDKATTNLRLDPDWPTILQICDLIRQNDCTPKQAIAGVKKKLDSENPHQAMFALLTLESIVKNCGSGVHDEVASKAFCEMLRDLVKNTQHENLRTKILELIQAWAFAFRNSPKYRCVQDTVNILKAESYKFPPLKESDAMFSADTAPEWAEGEVCHRCRAAFSVINRRHHCRACGQVFCGQCSAKKSTIPKFGIEKEVRVCDACFDKVSRPPTSSAKLDIVDTSNDYGPAQAPKKAGKSAEELQEEEELQLALALSQSEAEQKEKERRSRSYIAPVASLHPTISPTPSSVSASPDHSAVNAAVNNPELSRYLDRGYWEQRRENAGTSSAPTAPASHLPTSPSEDFSKASANNVPDEDAEYKEIDDFVGQLRSQIEIFVNRMKSNSSRGRSIANDTSVQTLFMNITAMHSRLLKYIQQQDDKRVYLESLQDKISQIRDSRAALDTLRAEHAAREAAAAAAAERRRQGQMAAKLDAMRKKKHEYLQYQRHLALQRVQEQERELQMRQEQQKHQYMMSSNPGYFNMSGGPVHQFPSQFNNQQMYGNPQLHPQMMVGQPGAEQPMSLPGQMPPANPMSTMPQSMPQLPYTFANTASMPMSQQQVNTSASAQPNIRPAMTQPMTMHPMMMQQMQQMRMSAPGQPSLPQNMGQNIPNGQNVAPQNGQLAQKPNQPQQIPNSGMPHLSTGPTNLAQQPITTNPMMMHMQNVRHPGIPNSSQLANQQVPTGYPINMQSNVPPQMSTSIHQQGPSMPPHGQPHMMMQGQPMVSQGMPMQAHAPPPGQMQMPTNQGQMPPAQNQQVNPMYQNPTMQQMPQQSVHIHGMPQAQHAPQQGGNVQPPQMQMQGPPGPQPQQYPQQMPPQGMMNQQNPQQISQVPQTQPMKMPQQNFPNNPQGANPQAPPQVKSENNNNTAELISFD